MSQPKDKSSIPKRKIEPTNVRRNPVKTKPEKDVVPKRSLDKNKSPKLVNGKTFDVSDSKKQNGQETTKKPIQRQPVVPKITKPAIVSTKTVVKSVKQPIKANHAIQPKISGKNVMNSIHNVTVSSPPPQRKAIESPICEEVVEVIPRERTKTRTLEQDEIKILKHPKESYNEPTTATIKNPVAFEIKFEDPVKTKPSEVIEDDYEDDFESYESDFESESHESESNESSELNDNEQVDYEQKDERKYDSGTYELLKPIDDKQKQQFDSIDGKDTISSCDSGIGNPIQNITEHPSHDIEDEYTRNELFGRFSRSLRRGEDLMKKITLDTITFAIFEMKPRLNDPKNSKNKLDNFLQTDEPKSLYIDFASKDEDSIENRFVEKIDDELPDVDCPLARSLLVINKNQDRKLEIDEIDNDLKSVLKQPDFLIRKISNNETIEEEFKKSIIPFCDQGFVTIENPLKNYQILQILSSSHYLFTVFNIQSNGKSLSRYIIGVSDIRSPSEPLFYLSTQSVVCCMEVHPRRKTVILAGHFDGSIAVWDTEEPMVWHTNINGAWLCIPSHVVCVDVRTKLECRDYGAVVSIRSLYVDLLDMAAIRINSLEVCSLHEYGLLTMWTITQEPTIDHQDLSRIDHQSPWSKTKILQTNYIDLTAIHLDTVKRPTSGFEQTRTYFEHNIFNDFALKQLQSTDVTDFEIESEKFIIRYTDLLCYDTKVYISTNKNFILRGTNLLNRNGFKKIVIDKTNLIYSTSLKRVKNYLLIGFNDGSVKKIHCIADVDFFPISNINRRSTVERETIEIDSINAKSCAIQNIVESDRQIYDKIDSDDLSLPRLQHIVLNDDQTNPNFNQDPVLEQTILHGFLISKNNHNFIDLLKDGSLLISFNRDSGTIRMFDFCKKSEVNVPLDKNWDNRLVSMTVIRIDELDCVALLLESNVVQLHVFRNK